MLAVRLGALRLAPIAPRHARIAKCEQRRAVYNAPVPSGAQPRLILASASPRRRELLHNAHLDFTVVPADVHEQRRPGEPPSAYAERLAGDKARAVAAAHPGSLVLGADTIVVLGEEVLEKPADAADAARMLRCLSDRTHQVITGVCLAGPGFEELRSEVTDVTMGEVPEAVIAQYVATGEPMDKAGAYAIQGMASRWVLRLDGDYFNVVGLPVALVYRMLRARGAL